MTTQNLPVETTEATEATQQLVTQIPSYGLIWFAYIALTLLMVGIIWYGVRKWHFIIKWFFASVIFAGALTPAHPAEGISTFSPLVLNAMVDLFDGNKASFMADLKTITLIWAIIFVLGIIAWFIFKKLKTNKTTTPEMDTKAVMATPVEPKIED